MLRLSSLVCVALFGMVSVFACSSDDKMTLSQQGESCQRTDDCAKNLACFGGACQPANVEVKVNTSVCKAIQCQAAADCCDVAFTPSGSCASYQTQCDLDPTTYASYCELAKGPTCKCSADNFACEENVCKPIQCKEAADCCSGFTPSSSCTSYAEDCATDPTIYASECTYAKSSSCVCDATTKACNNNICTTRVACTSDTTCSIGVCSKDGFCVACETDTDCDSGEKCTGNVCVQPQCTTDAECPIFSKCQTDNTCKAVGCASDRECMTYKKSYLAICNKDASPVPTCEVACERDAQCKTTENPLGQCVSGRCQDAGCESNEECKIRLEGTAEMNLKGVQAVCVAPTT